MKPNFPVCFLIVVVVLFGIGGRMDLNEKRKRITKWIILVGIGYPVLALFLSPILLLLSAWLLDRFPSNVILAQTCFYIYFSPCLIGYAVTDLLIPFDLFFYRTVTFFVTQIAVYYVIGWIIARLIYRNDKSIPIEPS